ncbi:alpha/beta fold hydrolase [Pelomonas sp. V22]|uniref:alpha/beta fold hydrolase n=1 Tax=Pelomonas sp. V22 TaxID=2822139 RepID=UPI0024A9513D|nr:alpha/beta hydrolase [Pelomonas sp. V22]MDI4635490.1 alpha/beta fold hydrolase [Pelomonas sp. V22]
MKTIVAMALFGLLLGVAAAAPQARLTDVREETLVARDGSLLRLTHGRVRVPESRERPGGPFIDLAVVRINLGTAQTGHAHVLLAGGPGDSGVRVALDLATQGGAMLKEVLDGDLIGIDQRGTGGSVPNLSTTVRYELPLDQPASETSWLSLAERASRAVAAQMHERGIDLQAYNTEESADDMDAVRQALGEERWTLWGRSYGSHLALATARRHPQHVDRMVLVSPEGPDHTWKLPSLTDAALQRIAERAGAPEVTAQLREATARLARAAVHLDVPDPASGRTVGLVLGALDLQWLIAQVIGDPRAIATLPAAAREMAAGDFRRIGPLALRLRRQAGVGSAMKHMMDLSSNASAARLARIAQEAAGAVLGDAMNFPDRHLHAAWQAQAVGEAFRQPVTVPVPTLLLVGDLDARTPLENAREIAAALPRAHLVVVENAAHQFDLFGPPELRRLLGRFVRGIGDLPAQVTLPPLRFQGQPRNDHEPHP